MEFAGYPIFRETPKKDILVWTVVTYCGRWTLFPSQNPRARASSRRGKMVTVTALLMVWLILRQDLQNQAVLHGGFSK